MTSMILRTVVRLLIPVVAVISLYFLIRGHDSPGGGFIAALIGGSGIVLIYFARGDDTSPGRRLLRMETLVASGVIVAVMVGLVPIVLGHEFLEGAIVQWDMPLLGEIKLTSSLIFDLGVYLVVVGVIVSIVDELGAER